MSEISYDQSGIPVDTRLYIDVLHTLKRRRVSPGIDNNEAGELFLRNDPRKLKP